MNNKYWFYGCSNTNTLFYNLCKKWLCDDYRKNVKRMKVFSHKINPVGDKIPQFIKKFKLQVTTKKVIP